MLEITVYGDKKTVVKNLKKAVEWIDENVSEKEELMYYTCGIEYRIEVRKLKKGDWFPGKKEKKN